MNACLVNAGFNRTYIFIQNMAKNERYLHKSNKEYDFSNPTYACGAPVEHRPNLTDAQALALKTCPKCFPNGTPQFILKRLKNDKKQVLKVDSEGAGWI